ncbi:MAG: hypothetical protein K6T61_06115 [Bryobacteraceae bacterium]|nr:hypothetical protein [Bryobacteraceae bacterium]
MHRRIARLLLAFVFAASFYRAATQSATTDEAFSYNLFLSGSWSRLFGGYDAAHHVLYSILAKISVTVFGLSEFTLRLPALAACLLYLAVAYRLCRRLFPDGPLFLLPLALLTLNPHLMDFFSAARGYGLALALLLLALEQALGYLEAPSPNALRRIALILAFAVSANLTTLVPATALGTLLSLTILLDPRLGDRLPARGRFWLLTDNFFLPSNLTAFVILILPLIKARPDHFYFGASTARESLHTLVEMSYFHHPLPDRLAAIVPGPAFWYPLWAVLFPLAAAAALLACLLLVFHAARRGGFSTLNLPSRALLFAGGTLSLSVVILLAAHRFAGVRLPYTRTGLYFVPLLILTLAAMTAALRHRPPLRFALGWPLTALGLLSLAQFAAHFQCNHYGEWRFDRSTKRIVEIIRSDYLRWPRPKVRVGSTWVLEPTLNFYRRRYRLAWMSPVERGNPDADFDYYVLLTEDHAVAAKRSLRILFADPFAGVLLAEPPSPPGAIDAPPARE